MFTLQYCKRLVESNDVTVIAGFSIENCENTIKPKTVYYQFLALDYKSRNIVTTLQQPQPQQQNNQNCSWVETN